MLVSLVAFPAAEAQDCIDYGGGIRTLARLDLENPGLGIAVAGDYVYLANWSEGLRIVDISDPALPTVVGSVAGQGIADDVEVSGGYAYMIDGGGLRVIDVSDPANPVIVGSHPMAYAQAIYVFGDYAYVTSGFPEPMPPPVYHGWIHVFDISDPTSPTRVGESEEWGRVTGIAVRDGYAFVGGSGLAVVDVSNPALPFFVEEISLPGSWSVGVTLNGDYAYVANREAGLQIVDISNPALPVQVGSADTPDDAVAVAVAGGYAYLAEYDGGLAVVDVSDPASPLFVGRVNPYDVEDVVVAGDLAFVSSRDGMSVLDVAVPVPTSAIGGLDLGLCNGLDVSGDHTFLATDNEVMAVDISDPGEPRQVGVVGITTNALDVVVEGSHAYVTSPFGLEVVDITDPTAMLLVGGLRLGPLFGFNLDVNGSYAYLPDITLGLHIVDVSVPASPVLVSTVLTPYPPWDVRVAGGYAYATCHVEGLVVIDISDPSSPVIVGSVATPNGSTDLAIAGSLAYVGSGRELLTVDISDPTAPAILSSFTLAHNPREVEVDGDFAYVAREAYGLEVVDISDPFSPSFVGEALLDQTEAVVVHGGLVHLGDVGYRIFAVQCPEATSVDPVSFVSPAGVFLYPNRPNPFRPQTTIIFDLPVAARATVRIYDVGGRLVRTLADGWLPRDSHRAVWNGRDDRGGELGPGIYFAQLRVGDRTQARKLTMLER
jgi:hypothetical protein